MGIVVGCFVIAIFVNTRDLSRVAHRLKDIEHEVTGRAGEHLLVWETLGGVVTQNKYLKKLLQSYKNVHPLPTTAA